jgi:DNA repair protein RecO
MNQRATTGIILHRTNYGEADRIVTILTPDMGKLHLLARGVRKIKAKLAGGTELFSISSITFIQGRGDLGTLISARLEEHFNQIAKDIDRTMLGYDLIKMLDHITEDEADKAWFELLKNMLESLNDSKIDLNIVRFWFQAHILLISGYSPNLEKDNESNALKKDKRYQFDIATMSFIESKSGTVLADQIKFMRLGFSNNAPSTLQRVSGAKELSDDCSRMLVGVLKVSLGV